MSVLVRVLLATCFLALAPLSLASDRAGRLQIGYCGRLTEVDAIKAAGFDYIEVRTTEIAALSDDEFANLLAKLHRIQLPASAAYLLVPASLKLTGPTVDKEQQMAYIVKAFDRLAKLGVRVICFGSGPARQVPDGYSKQDGFAQLVDFCKRIAPEAERRHLTIAIEPQRLQESNIINSTVEALKLIEAVHRPSIQLMIDFYHMAESQEDPAVVLKARDHIRHLHMANPRGRVFPLRREEYDYEPFFRRVRQIGYDARISLEVRTADFATEAPQSIAFLRRAFTSTAH